MHPFIEALEKVKEPENFNENRLIGENEDEICRLIRQDLIKEFIVYINKENVNLHKTIKNSIYETNSLLLIEYATFCGSIQIFKYLQNNNVKLTESLWMYAVHGQNPEIFNILEEKKIELPNESNNNKEEEEEEDYDDDNLIFHKFHHNYHYLHKNDSNDNDVTFEDCFFEAIKCHHDVASFIALNYLKPEQTNSLKYLSNYLKYHNFSLNKECVIDESSLFSLCKYNHYYILDALLKNKSIDLNKTVIFDTFLIQFFLQNFYGIFI